MTYPLYLGAFSAGPHDHGQERFLLLLTRPIARFLRRFGDPRGLGADCRIAVCGTHRSGTTLLGGLLSADRRCQQIFEPFNPASGIAGATQSFLAADWPGNDWQAVIDGFLNAEMVSFRRLPKTHGARRLTRWVKGTRLAREYVAARLFRPRRLVIKCPFMSLSSEYLIHRHGILVVFAVKHPASFFVSLRRVGWHGELPLDDMVAQGVIAAAARDAATTPAARAALFWHAVNTHALETRARFPGATAIWSHERFCRDPDAEMARLTMALRIDYSARMQYAVSVATHGDVVRPPSGTVHQLVRDTAGMAGAWRDQLSSGEEAELRVRCGALYEELIGERW